jgi:hypothetical protein
MSEKTPEAQLELTKVERPKIEWPKMSFFAILFGAVCTLSGVGVAFFALSEYTKANRAEARAQLYGAERSISEAEIRDPILQRLYANPSTGVDANGYIKELLSIAAFGDPRSDFEPFKSFKHARDIYDYIWGAEQFNDPGVTELRKLYLHAELYIYHLHNCFDLKDEAFITPNEWETWRHLIDEIGPHPVTLAVIISAEDHRYFSKDFATMLQNSFRERKLDEAVVRKLYPDILKPTWPEKFQNF